MYLLLAGTDDTAAQHLYLIFLRPRHGMMQMIIGYSLDLQASQNCINAVRLDHDYMCCSYLPTNSGIKWVIYCLLLFIFEFMMIAFFVKYTVMFASNKLNRVLIRIRLLYRSTDFWVHFMRSSGHLVRLKS